MRDEHDRAALLLEREDAAEALALERLVADGEDLVEQQDVRVEERGDGEAEPHRHPGGVRAHRPVDRVLQLCERHDLVEPRLDIGAAEALDRAVQEHVLAAGEVEVEAGAELEERADAALGADAPRGRPDDPRDDAQQRRLARAVAADQAHGLAPSDLGGDVAERPDVSRLRPPALDDEILERARLPGMNAEEAGDAVDGDLANLHAA